MPRKSICTTSSALSSSRDVNTAAKIASLVTLDWPLANLRADPSASDVKDRTVSSKRKSPQHPGAAFSVFSSLIQLPRSPALIWQKSPAVYGQFAVVVADRFVPVPDDDKVCLGNLLVTSITAISARRWQGQLKATSPKREATKIPLRSSGYRVTAPMGR